MKNIIKSFSKKVYTKFTANNFNLNNNELLKQEEKWIKNILTIRKDSK